MKTRTRILSSLGLLLAGAVGEGFAQGSLTPPAGTPSPTLRTLLQVEPRTPIAALPFTITAPGSYYLTTNLTTTGDGIRIDADGVTLDLMGFTLSGNNSSGYYGVALGAGGTPVNNGVLRNGTIRNFGDGLYASACQSFRVEQIASYSNKNSGIKLSGSSSKVCANNAIRDCMIAGNGFGVYLIGNIGVCRGNTLVDCMVAGNNSVGIQLHGQSGGACNGNTIRNCTINDNGYYGVYLVVSGDGSPCEGNLLADCTLSRNTTRGIWLSAGVNGNRVEGNHLYGQLGASTTGIDSDSSGNLIFRNTCVGQTNNFSLSASDTYGPIVTASGALSTTNGAAGLSPWANFSR